MLIGVLAAVFAAVLAAVFIAATVALAGELVQLGVAPRKLLNYNGSWAEYSRLGLPLQTGDTP